MPMSKKDFILLADHIRPNLVDFGQESLSVLANYCQQQNPRFMRSRWYDYIHGRCGPNGGLIRPPARSRLTSAVV